MSLVTLLQQISQCTLCEEHLQLGANPVVVANPKASILIIGQAPGTKVHATGIPWNDPSGERLRDWLAVDKEMFYNPENFAIMPMGFCYPGRGKSGDLPPRPECATTWHKQLLAQMPNIELTLLIGQYAQNYYLTDKKKNLTETVKHWQQYSPKIVPLPHPSPRNRLWLKKNDWFERDVVPYLREQVNKAIR